MKSYTRSRVQLSAALLGGVAVILLMCHQMPAASVEADPRADAVMTRQQAYFQTIATLLLDCQYVVNYAPAAGVPGERTENGLHFVYDKGKYRSEVTYVDEDAGVRNTLTLAFDGDRYQELMGAPDALSLGVTHRRPGPDVYGGPNPLLTAFTWAFSPGDERSLATLQAEKTWSSLAQLVVACEDTAWDDAGGGRHEGIKLRLVKSSGGGCLDGQVTYEVFFDAELDYFPVRWRSIIPGNYTCDTYVLSSAVRESDGQSVAIPLRLEWTAHRENGDLMETGFAQLNADTVKVNEPIAESQFSIPLSGVRHYRDDAGAVLLEP